MAQLTNTQLQQLYKKFLDKAELDEATIEFSSWTFENFKFWVFECSWYDFGGNSREYAMTNQIAVENSHTTEEIEEAEEYKLYDYFLNSDGILLPIEEEALLNYLESNSSKIADEGMTDRL